ncbi:MAG: InlB B-repeat-containing protein [Christensenellales bacterium]
MEKKISLTVRFRLVDQSAKDMQLETADWDGALLTEATVQYTGDSCPMGAVNMMDSIEAAFAEKYPDLQEQYVLLPEMRSADPWSKVYRLNGGESCFAVAENYVYLSREGDVVFPLTDDSTLVAEFPVYVYRYGEQDGRITYRVRISGARPDYFTPSLTLRSGAVASFTFDKERGEWVTQFKRSDFGADERALIHLTGLRGEETAAFLPVTGREERRIVTLTWTADTQRVTIDAQNVLWGSDMPAEGNDLLCRAGEQVTVQIAPAAGYRGIHVFLSDPAVSLSISEGNDAASFLMPYAPLTLTLTADKLYTVTMDTAGGDPIRPIQYTVESEAFQLPTPVRTGYIFLGWTGEGITEPQKTIEIPQGSTGDRTYTANWQVIEYTIITLLEGGNAGSSQVYFYTVEQTVTLPTPTRTGYTFLGWTGEGITTPQPNVTIPKGSTGDKTYIENWKLTEYNITMDLNGGSGQEKVVYTMTDEDFELPTPTRNGYEFVGWTGEGITTPQTSVKIPKGSTGNKAYTANWQVIEYTITLDTNGGPVVSPIKYTVEDLFTLPYILRPGYEFAGWTLDGSGMLPFTPLIIYPGTTGDLHYKAEWRLAEYTITMDLDGGSGQEKVVYTITDEEFELPTPTRNGYEFVGWTGERITTPQTSVKIPKGSTGNKAYTANWKVIRYTITLVTNGGAVIASIRYTVEDSVTLPIPPDRPGYEFSGWVLDGSGQFPSTPMIIPKGSTGDRIYKAEWRVATYTITFVSHGRVYNWVQYTINNQVYFGTPEEDPSYYLPGYTFVGWKIDGVEGTPRSYMLPKGSYGNRTATMLWEPIP